MNGIPEVIGTMYVCRTVWGFPRIDSTTVDCGAVELDDLTFRRTSFPQDEFSAGRDKNYLVDYIVRGFPQIDSAAVDCDTGAVELDDLIFRRMSFPPGELSAGRDGDYIWLALLAGLSVRTRSVTGSLLFGSPHRLGRSCLWLAALSLRWIGSADVPLCHHLLSVVIRSAAPEVELYWFFLLYRHPVWPDGGSVSSELDVYRLGMYLYAPLCRHLLSLDPAVRRTASCEVEMHFPPTCFRLILTFCYCFYGFFRELDVGSGRSPDRNKADAFHAPTRWAKLCDFAPDIQDAMELRALRPHAIFVKVIYTLGSQIKCNGHPGRVFRKVSGTVSASPLLLDMTVMSTSGVIASPTEVPVRNVLPLATVVNIMYAVSTGTPFVVPPAPGIERPVIQALDFSRSCEFLSLFRLSTSSPAPTLPRDSAKDSSPFLSLDRVPPLRGNTSPPAGETLLQPPTDDCVASGFGDPNTAAWCEQYLGSESP